MRSTRNIVSASKFFTASIKHLAFCGCRAGSRTGVIRHDHVDPVNPVKTLLQHSDGLVVPAVRIRSALANAFAKQRKTATTTRKFFRSEEMTLSMPTVGLKYAAQNNGQNVPFSISLFSFKKSMMR